MSKYTYETQCDISISLSEIPTEHLVRELKDREGVDFTMLSTEVNAHFEATGPAIILWITD